jgi:GTPase SAR1 family protein
VGNKCDKESERKVSTEQGKDFAAQYGMKFLETSAKDATNVSEAFITMTKEIIKKSNKKEFIKPKIDITKDNSKNINNRGGCC